MKQRSKSMYSKRRLLAERLEDRRMLAGPYAPAADQLGSTAIAMNDPSIVGWASEVVRYDPGTHVDLESQVSTRGLGPAEGTASDTVSLGRGGMITLGFNAPIRDGLGFDFAVFENSFSDTFLELAHVEVSSNGVDFIRFPSDSLTAEQVGPFGSVDPSDIDQLAGKYRAGFGTPFDLGRLEGIDPELDLTRVTHVRLVDIVGDGSSTDASGDPIYDPFPTEGSAGFDLDAVGVIHADQSVREIVGFEDLGSSLSDGSGFIGPVEGGALIVGPYGDDVVVGEFTSGSLSFNNANSLTYGSWNQFAYSNKTDVVTPGYQNDLSSFAGGGAGGSKTFGVGFMDQSGGFDPPTIRRQAGDTRLFESIKVTNTTYAALSMRDGDDFAKAFGGETGNDPDFFLLEITGRDSSGALIDSVEVFLADYRFVDNTKDYILDEWIEVDLSRVSNAESIEFTLSSSDEGDFGMNTPAYFAIDDIVLTEQVLPFDLADSTVLESDGDSATTARVSRPDANTANAVTVSIVPSDSDLVSVPASVTIAAGDRYAEFTVDVADDDLFQGTRAVLIEASVVEWTDSSRTLVVVDDEIQTLERAPPSSVDEGDVATAIVTRNDADQSRPLVVSLASSDTALVTLPGTITIPVGQASAEFLVSGVEDDLYRDSGTVSVSVSAGSYLGDSEAISVVENDSPALSVAVEVLAVDESDGAKSVRLEDLGRRLAAESFYNGSDEAGGFVSDGLRFSNEYNSMWGSWSGWAYSKTTDTTTPGYTNQYSVFVEGDGLSPGRGSLGSDTYAVAATFSTPRVTRNPMIQGAFETIDIANTTYAALSMQQGDDFAKKFGGATGDDPDFFLLTIEGLDSAGQSQGTVEFYLADYRSDDNELDYIVDQWTTVDVSSLGDAVELTFSLTSSDVGQFGMNTPAYFAADRFTFADPRPPKQVTLSRNTVDVSLPVDVQLTSLDRSELQLPDSVTIPQGASSINVPLTIVDDALVDGAKTVQVVANAEGFDSSSASILVTDDDQQQLSLTLNTDSLFEGGSGQAVVHRNVDDLSESLSVTIAVEPVGQLVVPQVVIPVGARSVVIAFSATDNDIVDEDRVVSVTANASGFASETVDLLVRNEDVPPELSLSIDRQVLSESANGFQVATATITRTKDDLSEPVEVFLTTDSTGQVTLPSSVVIPALEDQVDFSIGVIDDLFADGDQQIEVEANADRYIGSLVNLTVIDDEVPTIFLSLSSAVIDESSGSAATQLVLQRNTLDLSESVVVELSSTDVDILMPERATFGAGEKSVTVSVGVQDNMVLEGDRFVQLGVSALGFVAEPVELRIADNEAAAIRLNENAGTVVVGELLGEDQFGVSLAAQPLSDVVVEVSSDSSDIEIVDDRLVFTPLTWNQIQTVTVVGVPDLLIDPMDVSVQLKVDIQASDSLFSEASEQFVVVQVEDEQPAVLRMIEDDESVLLLDVDSGVLLRQAGHAAGLQVVANLLPQDFELGQLVETTGAVEFDAAGGDDRVWIRGTRFTQIHGGSGLDQLWLDLDQPADFVDFLTGRVDGFEEYGIASEAGVEIVVDLESLGELLPSGNVPVLRLARDQDVVFKGAAIAEDPVMDGTEFAQVIRAGEQRVHVISDQPWQNALSKWDVNYDGKVTANDALFAINQLARMPDVTLPAIELLSQFGGAFFDTSGDGLLTARDPLLVINELARRVVQAEGELSMVSTPDFGLERSQSPFEIVSLPPVTKKIVGMPEQIDQIMESVRWDEISPHDDGDENANNDPLYLI
ncbi:MAG: DUF4465 domain-containing protein [Planctomycetota bacterium]|nr:DUF4465 domain-containing protein [Planctomycetota bacterium]